MDIFFKIINKLIVSFLMSNHPPPPLHKYGHLCLNSNFTFFSDISVSPQLKLLQFSPGVGAQKPWTVINQSINHLIKQSSINQHTNQSNQWNNETINNQPTSIANSKIFFNRRFNWLIIDYLPIYWWMYRPWLCIFNGLGLAVQRFLESGWYLN